VVLASKASYSVFNRARFARVYYIDQQIRAGKYPNAPKLARELEVQPTPPLSHIQRLGRGQTLGPKLRQPCGSPVAFKFKAGNHCGNTVGHSLLSEINVA